MEIQVDAAAFMVARIITAAAMALVAGVAGSMAAEHYKLAPRVRALATYGAACAAAILSFLLGWASMKLTLLPGVVVALLGGILVFNREPLEWRVARILGGIVLVGLGGGWCYWFFRAAWH